MRLHVSRARLLGATSVAAATIVAGVLATVVPVGAAVTNPPVQEACGLDITLVLDASGSIQSSNAVDDVRDAADAFLTALKDTNSTARVIDFGTVARETAAAGTLVTSDSLAAGGVHRVAVNKYYNPKPPIQSGVTPYEFRSGNVNSTSSYRQGSTSSTQYTNWDQALHQVKQSTADLVVFITDGDPTAVDSDQPGDPFYVAGRNPPNVRYNMSSGAAQTLALNRAVEEADQIKTAGSRILTVGVGNAVTGNTASVNRLKAVSGPNVANTIAQFDITTTDVALVSNFAELGAALRGVVTELCAPSFTIRKLAQTPGSTAYTPQQGRQITLTPTVQGAGTPPYTWILPQAGLPVGPVTRPTDVNGFVQFQWEPNPSDATTTVTVSEATGAPYTPVDYRCELRDIDGNVTVVQNTFAGSFTLDVPSQDIVTCTLRNSYDYAPAINIAKVDSPTVVRGDLTPPAQVTSTFTVTNPGNADLGSVSVSDDRCAPVTLVSGDTNSDAVLQTTETWTYTCVRDITAGSANAPITITNTARVDAIDPNQTAVFDTATANITVLVPVIDIAKTVRLDGTSDAFVDTLQITGTQTVQYQMVVTNPSNVALGTVTVTDPDCSPITGPTGDTNTDNVLQTTETWTYLCSTSVSADVVNTATASGVPATGSGLATPGPAVTATDTAAVTVVDANLDLTKTVDITVALPGDTATYTYTVTNSGGANLRPIAPVTRATLVDDTGSPDAQCPNPTYVSGDTLDDSVLAPAETWTYTCQAAITPSNNGTNVASVTMAVEGGGTLSRSASAFVELVTPGVQVTKLSLRPVVLDPAATAIAGPDVPLRSPAVYLYEVVNTGTLPLANVTIGDDVCGTPTFVGGDQNSDSRLDIDEVWEYLCVQTTRLTKADGVPASDPTRPSLVTNTATVTGTPRVGATNRPDKNVTSTDTAQTLVIAPAVAITKTADQTLVREGSDVTYTYEVTAAGDTGMRVVDVSDDKCSPVAFTGGDTDSDDVLDRGETWTYTCAATLFGPSPVVNTATVLATGGLGNLYTASTTETVELFGSDIALDKNVSDELVLKGSTVTYTFDVSNSGTDPVNDVLDQIALSDSTTPSNPVCNTPTFVSGDADNDDKLDVDEVWRYSCTGRIDRLTVDVAGVQGRDVLGGIVRDFDAAIVAPFTTGIIVDKVASPTKVPIGGAPVTYTYTVRNTGTVPLGDVKARITDDTCPNVTYVSGDVDGNNLLTGTEDLFESGAAEVWTFRCTTDVSVDTTNVVTAVGTPTDPRTGAVMAPDVSATDIARVTVDTVGSGGGKLPPTGSGGALPWQLMGLVVLFGAALSVTSRLLSRSRV